MRGRYMMRIARNAHPGGVGGVAGACGGFVGTLGAGRAGGGGPPQAQANIWPTLVLWCYRGMAGGFGPEPIHEGEALAKAIIETVERLTK
jgi:hypothetical protein